MNKILYIIILLLPFGLSYASAAPVNNSPSDKGRIEGRVYDKSEDIPVEYANVVVFSLNDSSMVTGVITNQDGKFILEEVPYGEYYVSVQFIGYEPTIISGVSVTRQNRHIDIGDVDMRMTALQLEATEITAERMSVEYRMDRRVINVGQDIDAAGSSAVDILEKAPSIRVDINGDVMLRGSSNFTVLVDGKPSILDGNEVLKQIPASSIENIEIITNPSARFDPDGTAGIINIIMKKTRTNGFGGVVNATIGTGGKYASDIFLNYKTGQFSFFGNIDWNNRQFPGIGEELRETYNPNDTVVRLSTSENAWLRNGIRLRGGFDYEMNAQTSLSFGAEFGDVGFGMDNFQQIHEFTRPFTTERFYRSDNQFRWTRNFYSLNSTLKRNLGTPDHDFMIYGFFSKRDGSQIQDQKQVNTNSDWNSIDSDPFLLRSEEFGPSKNYRLEMDYTRPVTASGKMEAGYHLRISLSEESYVLETFDYDQYRWITDNRYSRSADFKDNVHAIYGIYSDKLQSFEYQLGLRGEYTYRDISVRNTDEQSLIDRFDLFPTVHLSNRFLEKNQVMASYSRRIERPRGWYLEPYETYIDENTRRIGNPALLPEYTNSFELGYLRTLRAGNLVFDIYYRQTENKITNIQYFDPTNEILYNQFQNLNNDQATGVEGSLLYDITKWFNLNLSATFYHYRLDDRVTEQQELRTSNNWDTRMITGFKLLPNTRIQANFSYNSPTVTAQGRQSENFYTDLTIRQDFFERQLNITLRVSDVFATRSSEYERFGANFYTFEYRKPESRVFMLTLSYRLNNFRPQTDRQIGGGLEMEM
ncbi:MAG: TonB-dependent receptor domain-containing protein [Bacteroidales bacterium]